MGKKIIFIMGVSGSGKTTVGKLLAPLINVPFFDGDDLHAVSNIEKMKTGKPLSDEDRLIWLQKINKLARVQQQAEGAIIVCSALKEKYRSILNNNLINPQWIFLKGDYDLIYQRLNERKGHFMPPQLLRSQFSILEIPETIFTVNIDQPTAIIIQQLIAFLNKK